MASGETVLAENTTVHIAENQGQIAIGNYIVQIGSIHGGVVNIAMPAEQPQLRPRPRPVLLRPRRFAGLLDRKTEVQLGATTLPAWQPTEFYGQPGSGKTSLLRHLLYHLPPESFPDGMVYLPARAQPAADLTQALVEAFFESDDPLKLTEVQARHALQNQQALIALDDVQLSRAEVEALLDVAPNCAFLLASTERRLWADGRVVALPGLPPEDALTLMERELGRPLLEEERTGALTLCRLLNGHPLHLLQVVALAQREGLSLAEMTHHLPQVEADQALAAHLVTTLSEAEQRVLGILAAFSGGVPLPAEHLTALTGLSDPEPVVQSLLQRGLIQAHSPRYSLAGNLADLAETWDLTPLKSRALAYFATWAEAQPPATERLQEATEPILQLLAWGVSRGQWADVSRLGRAIEGRLALAKRWGAWGQVLQTTLQAAEATGDQLDLGWSLHQLGTRAMGLEEFSLARAHLSQALQVRELVGDRAGAAITRHNLNLLPPVPPPSNGQQTPPDAAPFAGGWGPILLSGAIIVLAGLLLGLGLLRLRAEGSDPLPSNLGVTFVTITPASVAFVPMTTTPLPTTPPSPVPPTFTPTASATVTPTASATATSPPLALACQPPATWVTYAAQPGDTLGSLAVRTNTDVFQLQQANCLPSFNLQAGQIVYLPDLPLPPTTTATWTATPTWTPTPTPTPTRTPQPVLAISPDRLQFGPTTVGETSPPQAVTFRNIGSGALVITELNLTGPHPVDFSLTQDSCRGRRLTQNEACLVELVFRPSRAEPRTASLIARDDTGAAPLDLRLDGRGLAPAQPDLVITDFRVITGTARANQAAPQIALPLTLVIQNQGDAEADIFTSLICEGQSDSCENPLFRLSFETTTALAPGQTVTFRGVGQLPPELAGQQIFVNAKADSCAGVEGAPEGCRVAESNEANNGAGLAVSLPRPDTPPEVVITGPDADLSLDTTDFDRDRQVGWVTLTLRGQATDAEDGPLPDAALAWTTDQSELQPAALGSGPEIQVPLYTPLCNTTTHRISLNVIDSDGNERTATRNITVVSFCVE